MTRFILSALLLLALPCAPAAAAAVRTPHVEAEIVSETTAMRAGEPTTVALRLKMDRGWHTYWQNPGDSGLPTTLVWKLPPGYTVDAIQWPVPKALPVGPLVNYGYEGEVLLLTTVTPPPDAAETGVVVLNARADWLVCKETCIPEGADLSVALPVQSASAGPLQPSRWGTAVSAARALVPQPLVGWQVSAQGRGASVELQLSPPSGSASEIHDARFFPFATGHIEASGAQVLTRDRAQYVLRLPVSSQLDPGFVKVAGVLSFSERPPGGSATPGFGSRLRSAVVEAPLQGSVIAGPRPLEAAPSLSALGSDNAPAEGRLRLSIATAMGFALLGGLLLNLMPCVFPVLSIKVLSFAQRGGSRAAMRMHGLGFSAGVVGAFIVLALCMLLFQAAGAQLGWGFQLQSPAVVAGLAILFFVMALNLSGVFEVGQLLPTSLAAWNVKNPYFADVWNGAVAVVIASPCTAPFMGAALGYALTEAPAVTVTVFAALGAGMALPYLLLAFFPAWRDRLPRPGAWMVRLKNLLAFPLYATVIWLAWVLGAQLDNDAVARLFVLLLLIAFALWIWRVGALASARFWRVASTLVLVMSVVVAWPLFSGAEVPRARVSDTARTGAWETYSTARVAEGLASGKPMFVDFTAAWCVTCQVNKRLVLNTDSVHQAFKERGVTLMRADWTRRDPEITRALALLGRNGVPVYVLYRPGREPLLLPEVLQPQTVFDALATL